MSEVDNYLAKVPSSERAELERIREIVHEVAPEAEEVISYGMPAFKYKGKYLVAYWAFKNHMSLFPTDEPVEAFKNRLGDFKLSKGTIQFTVDHPLPEELVREIVWYRMGMIEQEK